MLCTGQHRDAPGHAIHTDDGQVELADHHGQAEPERNKADGRENLQRAIGRGGTQKTAVASIRDSEQHNACGEDGERPNVRPVELAPQPHRPAPRDCRIMTASTIRPAARYCHSCRNPFSSSMTCTAAMTMAPANVRSAEP